MAAAAGKKLVAATFTPFTPEGEVNLSQIGPYIDYLEKKQGVKSLFVNGTTGESLSLSVAERKMLAKEWCEKGKDKMEVIVHVGCMSLKDSQELAKHAAEIKADAIAVMAPFFLKPKTAEPLKLYLQEVHLAAPNLPFYYYHIPSLTGIEVPARDVIEGIKELIPTFSGVKFTGTNLMDFGQCVSHSLPQWSCLFGVDEVLLAGLAMGADGAVGSTYNYLGCHINKLIAAFEKHDLDQARKIQFKMQELLRFAALGGFDLGVNKKLMTDLSHLPLGPPRLPVMSCPSRRAQDIKDKYFELFSES